MSGVRSITLTVTLDGEEWRSVVTSPTGVVVIDDRGDFPREVIPGRKELAYLVAETHHGIVPDGAS